MRDSETDGIAFAWRVAWTAIARDDEPEDIRAAVSAARALGPPPPDVLPLVAVWALDQLDAPRRPRGRPAAHQRPSLNQAVRHAAIAERVAFWREWAARDRRGAERKVRALARVLRRQAPPTVQERPGGIVRLVEAVPHIGRQTPDVHDDARLATPFDLEGYASSRPFEFAVAVTAWELSRPEAPLTPSSVRRLLTLTRKKTSK